MLAVALATAPLALGSAPTWALWPVVGLACAAWVWVLIGISRAGRRVMLPLLALVPALGALVCLLQVVPLPPSLLGLLSAPAAELRAFTLAPLGLDGPRPLSLDPPSTWRELAKQLGYLAAFLSAAHVVRTARDFRRLLQWVAGLGACLTLVGLAHLALGEERLFGAYRFEGRQDFLTPFGNPNHLAAYLTLSGTLSLALALSEERRSKVWLWGGAFVLAGVGTLLSLSRGGVVFFFVAQLLLAVHVWRTRRASTRGRADRAPARLWAVLGGIVAIAAISLSLASEKLEQQVSSTDSLDDLRHSKVELWPMFFLASREVSLAGLGRGAFEAGFARFQTDKADVTFTHPENFALQLGSEVGYPLALLLIVLSALGFLSLVRGRSLGVTEGAVVAAAIALVLHDVFDFSLEFPAAALTLWVLLGALAGVRAEPRAYRLPRPWIPAVALSLLALAGLFLGRGTLRAAEQELTQALSRDLPADEVRRIALRLIDRHPSYYALYDLVAQAYARPSAGRPAEALAFVNRALAVKPLDGAAHLVAARALLALGHRKQAFLEYRLSQASIELRASAFAEAVGRARGASELRASIPWEPKSVRSLVSTLRTQGRDAEAEEVTELALEELGSGPHVAELFVLAAAQRLRQSDPAGALTWIARAEEHGSEDVKLKMLKAEALSAGGEKERATDELQALLLRYPDNLEVALALSRHWSGLRQGVKAREALARVKPFVRDSKKRVQVLLLEGQSWELEGSPARAMRSFREAVRLEPKNPRLYYLVARSAEAAKLYPEALEAARSGIAVDRAGAAQEKQVWVRRLETKAQASGLEATE